jgi:sialate O-acetylesterase
MVDGAKKCRVDFSAMCWFYGRNVHKALADAGTPRPIGLIQSCQSGTPDEAWSSKDALAKCNAGGGSTLWNGMIVPLLNTTIKGAVWYQGESDSTHPGGAADGYNCTFPAMLADWRKQWHAGTNGETAADFPFGFVQLNSISNGTVFANPAADPTAGGSPTGSFSPKFGYAGLRWAQTAGYGYVPNPAMPNTFMAVSVDTPDRPYPCPIDGVPGADHGFGVHSPFKQPTAGRLARAGLALAYNMTFDTVGPRPSTVHRTPDGKGLVLNVDHVGSGLEPNMVTKGFEALVGNLWESVLCTVATHDTVIIANVPQTATQLRYNWYSNPCGVDCFGCAVYARVTPTGTLSGETEPFLPLPPFAVALK